MLKRRHGPKYLAQLAIGAALMGVLAPGSAAARTGSDVYATQSLLGSYLAGRIARGQHDTDGAADFYDRALQKDPDNEALIEQSLIMAAITGRFEGAIRLSTKLVAAHPDHRMAQLLLGLADAKAGRFDAADVHFKASANGFIGELTAALARAWILSSKGETKQAGELLDGIKQADWAQPYLRYHKALMLDMAGQRQDARQTYERLFRADSKTLRIALAYAHHASAAGDRKLARTIMDEHAKKVGGTPHPMAKALADDLKAGRTVGLLIAKPVDGLAEVFYGLGELLAAEGNLGVGAIYLHMSLYLQDNAPLALAALANVHETTKQYDAAIATYDRIPAGTPLQSAVDIRKALNLNQLDRIDEAKALLEKLAAAAPTDIRPLDALGSILRGHKRFQEASDYYTRAINLLGPRPEKKHWTYFYARGTCYERLKRWPAAEADLQKALQLSPDQPLVLNYLGYSWIDQNRNLRQGMAMIEKAVSLKPDDGYIVDSLGWAHYRQGNFKEAVKFLERAVELRPEDPVLNDHLGDAFWRVGRRTEARFQWEQALTLKPEPEDATKIREKLEKGLAVKAPTRPVKRAKTTSRPDQPRKQSKLNPQRVPQ